MWLQNPLYSTATSCSDMTFTLVLHGLISTSSSQPASSVGLCWDLFPTLSWIPKSLEAPTHFRWSKHWFLCPPHVDNVLGITRYVNSASYLHRGLTAPEPFMLCMNPRLANPLCLTSIRILPTHLSLFSSLEVMDGHFNNALGMMLGPSLQTLSIPTSPLLSSLGLQSVIMRVLASVPLFCSPALRQTLACCCWPVVLDHIAAGVHPMSHSLYLSLLAFSGTLLWILRMY